MVFDSVVYLVSSHIMFRPSGPDHVLATTTVCLALSMKNKSFISLVSNNNHTCTMTLAWNERNQDFWPKIAALVSNLLSKYLFVVLIVWDKCVLVLIFTLFTNLFKDHSPDSFKDTMVAEKNSNSSFKMELVCTITSLETPIAFSGWQLGDKIQYSWQLSQIPVFQSVPNFWGTNFMNFRFVKDSLKL